MQRAISDRFWLLETLGFAADIHVDIDLTDGIRIQFPDHRIIHLQASTNAPELRLYGDGIHLTVAHKREWSYGFKPVLLPKSASKL